MADRLPGGLSADSHPYREILDGDPDRGVLLFDGDLQLAYANPVARSQLHTADGALMFGLRGAVGAFRDRLERSETATPPGEILLAADTGRPLRVTLAPVHRGGVKWFVVRVAPPGCFAQPNVRRLQSRFQLSPREAQITAAVAKGLSNGEISTELGITVKTVKNTLMAVFPKVAVRNRVELALKAPDAPVG